MYGQFEFSLLKSIIDSTSETRSAKKVNLEDFYINLIFSKMKHY